MGEHCRNQTRTPSVEMNEHVTEGSVFTLTEVSINIDLPGRPCRDDTARQCAEREHAGILPNPIWPRSASWKWWCRAAATRLSGETDRVLVELH